MERRRMGKRDVLEVEIREEDIHTAISAYAADVIGVRAGAIHIVDEAGRRVKSIDRAIIEIDDVVYNPRDDVVDLTESETYD